MGRRNTSLMRSAIDRRCSWPVYVRVVCKQQDESRSVRPCVRAWRTQNRALKTTIVAMVNFPILSWSRPTHNKPKKMRSLGALFPKTFSTLVLASTNLFFFFFFLLQFRDDVCPVESVGANGVPRHPDLTAAVATAIGCPSHRTLAT